MENATRLQFNRKRFTKTRLIALIAITVVCLASFVTATFAWYTKASPVETPISAGLYFIDANDFNVVSVAEKDETGKYQFMAGYGEDGFKPNAVSGEVSSLTVKAEGAFFGVSAVKEAVYNLDANKVYRINLNVKGSSTIPGYVSVQGADGVHYSHTLSTGNSYVVEIRPQISGIYTLTSSWGSCDADFNANGVYYLHNTSDTFTYDDDDFGNHWHICEYDGCDYTADITQHYHYEWTYNGANPYADGHQHICECNRVFVDNCPAQDYTVYYKVLFHDNPALAMTTEEKMPNALMAFEYVNGDVKDSNKSRVVALDSNSKTSVELYDGTYVVSYVTLSNANSAFDLSIGGQYYKYANTYEDSYLYKESTRIEIENGKPRLTLEGGETGWIEEDAETDGENYKLFIAEKFTQDPTNTQAWEYVAPARNGIGYDMYSRVDFRKSGAYAQHTLFINGTEFNHDRTATKGSGVFDGPVVISFDYKCYVGADATYFPTIHVSCADGTNAPYQILTWGTDVSFKRATALGERLGFFYSGNGSTGIITLKIRFVVNENRLAVFCYDDALGTYFSVCDPIDYSADIIDINFAAAHEQLDIYYDESNGYWEMKNFQINPLIVNDIFIDGWDLVTNHGKNRKEIRPDGANKPVMDGNLIAETQNNNAVSTIVINNVGFSDDKATVAGNTEIIVTPIIGEDAVTTSGIEYKIIYVVKNIYVDGVPIKTKTTKYENGDPHNTVFVTTGYFSSMSYKDFKEDDDPFRHSVIVEVEEMHYPGINVALTLSTRQIYSEEYTTAPVENIVLANKEVEIYANGINRSSTTNENGEVTINYVFDGEYTVSYEDFSWSFTITSQYDNDNDTITYTYSSNVFNFSDKVNGKTYAEVYLDTIDDVEYVGEGSYTVQSEQVSNSGDSDVCVTIPSNSQVKLTVLLTRDVTSKRDIKNSSYFAGGNNTLKPELNDYGINNGTLLIRDAGYIAFEGDGKKGDGIYNANGVPAVSAMGENTYGYWKIEPDIAYNTKYVEFTVHDPMVIFGTSEEGSNVDKGKDYSDYCLFNTGRNIQWYKNMAVKKGVRLDFGVTVCYLNSVQGSITFGTHVYVDTNGKITWNIRFGSQIWYYVPMTDAQVELLRTTGLRLGYAYDGEKVYGFADDGSGNMIKMALTDKYIKEDKVFDFTHFEQIGTHFHDDYVTGIRLYGTLPTFSLTQTEFDNGNVTYNSDVIGNDFVINAQPDDGYEIGTAYLNGEDVTHLFIDNVVTLKNYINVISDLDITFIPKISRKPNVIEVYGGYSYDIPKALDDVIIYFKDVDGKLVGSNLVTDGETIINLDASVTGYIYAHVDGYKRLRVTAVNGTLILERFEFTRVLDNTVLTDTELPFSYVVDDNSGEVTITASTASKQYIDNTIDFSRNTRIDYDFNFKFFAGARYYVEMELVDIYGNEYPYQFLVWDNAQILFKDVKKNVATGVTQRLDASSTYQIQGHAILRFYNDGTLEVNYVDMSVTNLNNSQVIECADFQFVETKVNRRFATLCFEYGYDTSRKPAEGIWEHSNFRVNNEYAYFYDAGGQVEEVSVVDSENLELFTTADLRIKLANTVNATVDKICINNIWFSTDGLEYARNDEGEFVVLDEDYGALSFVGVGEYLIENFLYDDSTCIQQSWIDVNTQARIEIVLKNLIDSTHASNYETFVYHNETPDDESDDEIIENNYVTMVGQTFGGEYKAEIHSGIAIFDKVIPDKYTITAHCDDTDCDFDTDYYPSEVTIDMRTAYRVVFNYHTFDHCHYYWRDREDGGEEGSVNRKTCDCKTSHYYDDTRANDGEIVFNCLDTVPENERWVGTLNANAIHLRYGEMNIRNPKLINAEHAKNWEGDPTAPNWGKSSKDNDYNVLTARPAREAGGTWFGVNTVDKDGKGKVTLTFGSVYFVNGTPYKQEDDYWALRLGGGIWKTIKMTPEQLAKFNTMDGLRIGVAVTRERCYMYVENPFNNEMEVVYTIHVSEMTSGTYTYAEGDYFVGVSQIGSNIVYMADSYTNLGTDVIVDAITDIKMSHASDLQDGSDYIMWDIPIDYTVETRVVDKNGNTDANAYGGDVEYFGSFMNEFQANVKVSPLYYVKSFMVNGYDILNGGLSNIQGATFDGYNFVLEKCYFKHMYIVVEFAPRVEIIVSDVEGWDGFNGLLTVEGEGITEVYSIYNSRALINESAYKDGSYTLTITGEGHDNHQAKATLQVLNGKWTNKEFYVDYDYSKHVTLGDNGALMAYSAHDYKYAGDNTRATLSNGTDYGAKLTTEDFSIATNAGGHSRIFLMEDGLADCAEATMRFDFSYTHPKECNTGGSGTWSGPSIKAVGNKSLGDIQILSWQGGGLLAKPFLFDTSGIENSGTVSFGPGLSGSDVTRNISMEVSFSNITGYVTLLYYKKGFDRSTLGNVTKYEHANATKEVRISTAKDAQGYAMGVEYVYKPKGTFAGVKYEGFGLKTHSNLYLTNNNNNEIRRVPAFTFDNIVIRHSSDETFDVSDFTIYKGYYEELPIAKGGSGGITIEGLNKNYFEVYEYGGKTILKALNGVPEGTYPMEARRGSCTDTFTVTVGDFDGQFGPNQGGFLNYLNTRLGWYEQANYIDDEMTFFIGDSFMDERWFFTDFSRRFIYENAYTFGVSSSMATQWHWFGQHLYKYKPINLVMHIGTNDIFDGGKSDVETTDILIKMFEDYHFYMPNTKMYWYSIEPRLQNDSGTIAAGNAAAVNVNANIKAYAEDKDWLVYVDSATTFAKEAYTDIEDLTTIKADASGTKLYKDDVHPNASGYDEMLLLAYESGLSITRNFNVRNSRPMADFTTKMGVDDYSDMHRIPGLIDNMWAVSMSITIHEYSTTAPGHISFVFDTVSKNDQGETNPDYYNRFLIMDDGKDGRFYFTGHANTSTRKQWSENTLNVTNGVDYTFNVTILRYYENAYMYVNGKLEVVFENAPDVNPILGFRVSTENMSATFSDIVVSYGSKNMSDNGYKATSSMQRYPGMNRDIYETYRKLTTYADSTFDSDYTKYGDTDKQLSNEVGADGKPVPRLIICDNTGYLMGGGQIKLKDVGNTANEINRDAWITVTSEQGISTATEGVALQFDFTANEWVAPTLNDFGAFIGISIESSFYTGNWIDSMFYQNQLENGEKTNNFSVWAPTNRARVANGPVMTAEESKNLTCTLIYQKSGGAEGKDRIILGMKVIGSTYERWTSRDLDEAWGRVYLRISLENMSGNFGNWRVVRTAEGIQSIVDTIPSFG